MIEIDYNQYVNLSHKFNDKPFDTTPAYVDFQLSKGSEVQFFVDSINQPEILCWAEIKHIKLLGIIKNIHGPIYGVEVSRRQLKKFFNNLKDDKTFGIYLNSASEYSVLFEESVRAAGFKRPIGQTSTNLSIVVDILRFDPDTNWRRNLKKASKESYSVVVKEHLTLEDCVVIQNLHKENAEVKNLSYALKANHIYTLCNWPNIEVFFLKLNDEIISARIVSIEENMSYDIFACNSLRARLNGATYFLMNSIFDYLKSRNIKYFDFSRIPMGRKGANGVSEFKMSSRGKVLQYNSEWIYFNNMGFRHMYYLYNFFILRKDFY